MSGPAAPRYSATASTVAAPSRSNRTVTTFGPQHTEQSCTYSCSRPPVGSTPISTVSPQCGQV